ncbi:amidohydrolase family protein [Sphingomonas sp. CFBP 8760]|uniref:amidohydrolase family protein n=1 Tax=Sphingomonas sp. CFBP 8760 TaxID=2775282 RepID=UPI0017836203|nr:amidohydrolase family protein [Sphingomonas sp. CFBP 8760]MBD8546734.1 amidohydrolase family protein [Sphingomonas sp. CFBP 8760]
MGVIDAHVHLWSLATPGHEWPTAETPALHRDFGAEDLRSAASGVGLDGVVLVQSQPTDADTDWMLAVAAHDPLVLGVVGWVDLAAPDAPTRIASLAANRKLRGLRPMLQSIDDTDWLLGHGLAPAVRAMIDHGLTFDALVQPRHLPMLEKFAARWPDLPVVIDHGAKPDAAPGMADRWRDGMASLAAAGAWCKLSGLRTEQAPGASADALAGYVAHLVASFGPRLMWGSDWPILARDGVTCRSWFDDAARLTGSQGGDKARLFAGAAEQFYSLEAQAGDEQ